MSTIMEKAQGIAQEAERLRKLIEMKPMDMLGRGYPDNQEETCQKTNNTKS